MSNPQVRLWDRDNPIKNKSKKFLIPNSNNPNVKGQNKKKSIDKKVPKKYPTNSSKSTKPCELDHMNEIT